MPISIVCDLSNPPIGNFIKFYIKHLNFIEIHEKLRNFIKT